MDLREETVGAALARVSRDFGDHRALVWLTDSGMGSMTWAQLHVRARAAGAMMLDLNPRRGRVAIAAPNSVEWIVAMFGCAMARMPVVPISPTVTESEACHMLSQAHATLILAATRVGDCAVYPTMCEVARQLPWRPAVCEITGLNKSPKQPAADLVSADAAAEFLIQHTSGTTGLPKAAVLSHRAALGCAQVWGEAIGLQTGETWLNPLPLHHVGGSVSGVLSALSVAGTYVVIERFSAQTVLRALRIARPAAVGLVPTMIVDLLAMPGVSPEDFSSVRIVAGGASAVDPGLIEDMEHRLAVTCLVGYGQSEAPAMAASRPSDPTAIRTQTLGHCLPGRDYYLCDRDGKVVPTGSVGELCVRGPLTMSGYLRCDGSIDPAADDAGWLHTGDLCSMDDHGVLRFRGRVREVIIRGGENIYPAEVEQVLAAHPSVAEAAVFGVPDTRLGERVVAAVRPAAGRVDPRNLAAFASARLSRHKRPTEWIVTTTLPRTSSGKVQKHVLRKAYEDGAFRTERGE
ncbi:AMP-dependent synthetase [Mycobacterium branderi]|uniref:AMP-dependent synthetase n=1 Tax=Mycobacterium branderi TaxID=43348 RepID=A0AA91LZQ2_9MYCO|nr:acyl--CoA ligase [Mycobacterium branderi]ORA40485.1 AMP-dependent synthetase [Mycobacterium branderi]